MSLQTCNDIGTSRYCPRFCVDEKLISLVVQRADKSKDEWLNLAGIEVWSEDCLLCSLWMVFMMVLY